MTEFAIVVSIQYCWFIKTCSFLLQNVSYREYYVTVFGIQMERQVIQWIRCYKGLSKFQVYDTVFGEATGLGKFI